MTGVQTCALPISFTIRAETYVFPTSVPVAVIKIFFDILLLRYKSSADKNENQVLQASSVREYIGLKKQVNLMI